MTGPPVGRLPTNPSMVGPGCLGRFAAGLWALAGLGISLAEGRTTGPSLNVWLRLIFFCPLTAAAATGALRSNRVGRRTNGERTGLPGFRAAAGPMLSGDQKPPLAAIFILLPSLAPPPPLRYWNSESLTGLPVGLKKAPPWVSPFATILDALKICSLLPGLEEVGEEEDE